MSPPAKREATTMRKLFPGSAITMTTAGVVLGLIISARAQGRDGSRNGLGGGTEDALG
jgi:hypothetical protein